MEPSILLRLPWERPLPFGQHLWCSINKEKEAALTARLFTNNLDNTRPILWTQQAETLNTSCKFWLNRDINFAPICMFNDQALNYVFSRTGKHIELKTKRPRRGI